MKSLTIGLLVLFGAATQANAQLAPPSGGEVGSFLKCFYECKAGPDVQGVATYQEITTIMLTNQSPDPRVADVFYFDGKEQCIAHSSIDLSPVDLDELNVCHTLESGGLVPPPAGLVEIIVSDPLIGPADGVYAWGKNVLGKFRTDNPEPFEGRVTGIGKYECRVVPIEVRPDEAVANACQEPLEVVAILVEETADLTCCPVCGDGVCEGDETECNCLSDCGAATTCGGLCAPAFPVCGDGTCHVCGAISGENHENCPLDCALACQMCP
jgi:hypothetical protein